MLIPSFVIEAYTVYDQRDKLVHLDLSEYRVQMKKFISSSYAA